MKKLLNYSEKVDESLKIVECKKMSNDILFQKYNILEGNIVSLKENQNIVLVEKGKVVDLKKEKGIYIIKDVQEENEIDKKIIIRKAENEELCVLFLNINEIKRNKYIIDKPIKCIEWKNGERGESYIRLEGSYDFKIDNILNFLSKVIGIRNHFSKQELIEKIRKYINNSIEKRIKQILEEYKLNINILTQKSKELNNCLKPNEYDIKLLEYGIKLICFDINKFEIVEKKFKFFQNNY